MSFPEDILNIKVEVDIDGSWTDITDYVYKESIQIERGSADESTYSQPTKASFLLNNIDGRFSPRNPNGPYYGLLHRNQHVLISVLDGPTFLDVASTGSGRALTADPATTTGDFDVRIELQANNWKDNADDLFEICGQMENGVGGWVFCLRAGLPQIIWSNDWVSFPLLRGDEAFTYPPSGRIALRMTVDVSTGTATFYQSDRIDGEWLQVGTPQVTGSSFAIPSNNGSFMVGDGLGLVEFGPQFTGKIFAASLRDSIDGDLIADIDFSTIADGDTAFQDAVGNNWTVEGATHVNNQWNRFKGQVTAWPTRWTTGGFDAWVEVKAETLVRRFLQGTRPLRSALARRLPAAENIVAYWPMEEGEDATKFYSPLPNVAPMSFNSNVDPGAHVGPHGSEDLPSIETGADWRGLVRGSHSGGWQVEFLVNLQQLTGTSHQILRVQTSGSVKYWRIAADNTMVRILGFDEDDIEIIDEGMAVALTDWLNIWTRIRLSAVQDGTAVDFKVTVVPVGGDGGTASFSEASATCGRVTAITGPDGGLHEEFSGMAIGHIAVFDIPTDSLADESTDFNFADHGFTGEEAYDRLVRLAEETGERLVVVGNKDDTAAMGAQRPDRLLDLMRECATADRGIFTDNRDVADWDAFKFIPRSALENQEPALTLDYTGDDGLVTPLDPTDDDLYLRNSITMGRERGSSFHVELATGPLSMEEVGEYEGGEDVNVETDAQLPDLAGWELHLGTWNEERYPTVRVLLQNAPHKIADVLKIEQGSVIAITNARDESDRTWIPPGDLLLMVRGYSETISQFQWEIEFQCVPARPYDVTVLETFTNRAERIDTDGTVLAAAVDSDDTSIELFTTDDQKRWTDDLEDYPFPLHIGGESMLAIGPGEVLTSNPLTPENATGYSGNNATIAWTQERVHPEPDALGSIKVTPNGTSASGDLRTSLTGTGTVNVGGRYTVGCWVWATNGLSSFRTSVNWYTSAGAYVSTEPGATEVIPPRQWTWVERPCDAPATASQLAALALHGGTPAATDTYYVWGLRASRATANKIQDDFTRTETDTWGTADTLQTWTNTGGAAADYDVVSTYGRHIITSTGVSRRSTIANPYGDSDIVVSLATAALSTGASQFAGPIARHVDSSNLYEALVVFSTTNTVTLSIRKWVSGVETVLASYTSGITNVAAQFVRVRFQVEGENLRAKIWLDGKLEPGTWHLKTTDSDLTTAGSVGVKSIRGSGNTNANADIRFGEFSLINPQTMEVQRSHNGIVKAQTAGEAVELFSPARLAI